MPELEEPTELIRDAILQLEEGHPAADGLPPSVWIARVSEQVALLALFLDSDEESEDDGWELFLIARLAAIAAEAVRGAARHHPDAERGKASIELVDWTLETIDRGAIEGDGRTEREPDDALIASVVMLGTAAAGAIAIDSEERGDDPDPERISAVQLEELEGEEAFAEGLFHVAEICRAGIAWALEARSEDSAG